MVKVHLLMTGTAHRRMSFQYAIKSLKIKLYMGRVKDTEFHRAHVRCGQSDKLVSECIMPHASIWLRVTTAVTSFDNTQLVG